MTGSTAIAEDVTQETFLALLLHGKRYDEARGTVASFLYGIARNLVMRRIDRRSGAEMEIIEECAGPEDLLEDLTRRESIEQVRQAVLSLPPVFREAVVLCDLQDSSYEEAAAALDCPVGTVRSRLSRGRAMLARKLRGAASGMKSEDWVSMALEGAQRSRIATGKRPRKSKRACSRHSGSRRARRKRKTVALASLAAAAAITLFFAIPREHPKAG